MEESKELHTQAGENDAVQRQTMRGAEQYRALRKTYPEFIYHGFTAEETDKELKVTYLFEISGLAKFYPGWIFPKDVCMAAHGGRKEQKQRLLKEMLFSLGLVELVSYWKLTCSPRVVIKAGKLNEEQIAWWKRLYFHGLGEFFYINQITGVQAEDLMEMAAKPPLPEDEKIREEDRRDTQPKNFLPEPGCRVLVPIGGGKDSAVTLELLKEAKADRWGYVINSRGATIETAKAAGLLAGKVLSAVRTLDKTMLELNRKGFLNGHTPFSAVVAFSSLVMAELYGMSCIALSNESSANESTIQGSTVNHQYSKSFQFEKDFYEYSRTFLPGSAYYFSMLRPLSEFQIAGYFSSCKAYHDIFRSCNVGSKADAWCGHCPKCLFVAAILSPFLSQEELRKIWGKNLFEDESLLGILEQLTGIQEEKPFECVGSRSEVNTALYLTVSRLEREGIPLPALLACYRTTPKFEEAKKSGDVFSDYFDEENLVPEPWKTLVRCRCAGEEARKRIR